MQKSIGILYGEHSDFALAIIDHIESLGKPDVIASAVTIGHTQHSQPNPYAVILDMISPRVPFYQGFLKHAALNGTTVINNPFSVLADDRYAASVVAEKILLNVPRTTLLPSHYRPEGTVAETFINMELPWNWEEVFEYVGFPAIMKPLKGENWRVDRVETPEELFAAHTTYEDQAVILQAVVPSEEAYCCFYVGNSDKEVIVIPYDPVNGIYHQSDESLHPTLKQTMQMHARALSEELGYDFCSLVFVTHEEEPHIIEYCDPVPEVVA